MNFSTRTDWNLAENELTVRARRRRAARLELLDLTVSTPTDCGFHYDAAALLAPLANPAALHYTPEPFGTATARAAVSNYYRDHEADINIDRLCLTTSTSEAYSFLFRLLCNPGDEVLAARPSYPLFDFIAQLDDVVLREYPLHYDPNADAERGWSIDLYALSAAITPRTCAILVVHPNNPTGNFVSSSRRHRPPGARRNPTKASCGSRRRSWRSRSWRAVLPAGARSTPKRARWRRRYSSAMHVGPRCP